MPCFRQISFCMVLTIAITHAFELPNISEFFAGLAGSKTEDTKEDFNRRKRQTGIGDESANDPWEVESSGIPMIGNRVNTRYMPTLSNGHIGVTVFDDALYLEGLYAGSGALTHRAKIPALVMSRVFLSDEELERRNTRKFVFNARYGVFTEKIRTVFADVEHSMYAHQKFIRLFVMNVQATMRTDTDVLGGGVIALKYPNINSSSDITFDQYRRHHGNYQIRGTVNSEGVTQYVHIFWMEVVTEKSVRGFGVQTPETFIMAVDRNEGDARSEFQQALEIIHRHGPDRLLEEHKSAWDRVWNEGGVEVIGSPYVAKIANFAQYYLLSSMPPPFPAQGLQHDQIYHGVGRTGLAKGALGRDYQGHVMWDNEIYILPAVLFFHPFTVRKVLGYRTGTADEASAYARRFNGKGYHYAYESALSGQETSSDADSCPDCAWKKYHTTGAVAWAFRQYYSATRDVDFRNNPLYSGCDVTRETARFFVEQAKYNPEFGRYDLEDITGPDETFQGVRNNAYTVVLASLAIHWARYFACICQRNEREEVPDDWIHKATLLNLPFDNVKRLHAPHQGYNPDNSPKMKQADTILLTYPLNWNMSHDIAKNDLDFFELQTEQDTPAMTYSFFTVGWKMVNEELKMQAFFQQSYQDYIVEPFKIWTEYREGSGINVNPSESSVNFLPGMGGFLQSLIYGFGGVRIRPQRLEFHNPQPPPGASELRLRGLKYLNTSMDITIFQDGRVTIRVINFNSGLPLILQINDTYKTEKMLSSGSVESFESRGQGFYLYTNKIEGCEHPRDYIYMPWGYSPFVDGSSHFTPNVWLTYWVLILLGIYSYA